MPTRVILGNGARRTVGRGRRRKAQGRPRTKRGVKKRAVPKADQAILGTGSLERGAVAVRATQRQAEKERRENAYKERQERLQKEREERTRKEEERKQREVDRRQKELENKKRMEEQLQQDEIDQLNKIIAAIED